MLYFFQCTVLLKLYVILLHAIVVLEARRIDKSFVTASHSGDWRGGGGEVCLSHECTQMFFHHHRLAATRKSGERGLMRWLVTGTSVMMSNSSVPQPETLLDKNYNSQTNSLFSTSHFLTTFSPKLLGAKMTSLEDKSVRQDQKPHHSFFFLLLDPVTSANCERVFPCWQRNVHSAVHRTATC